ncbi:hypothetical protein EDD85DRAFT_961959 [Armillaria nabsnona]|nr:hypothetical protein EDD85DRAFT_961959 [Armillaria nabsnona]
MLSLARIQIFGGNKVFPLLALNEGACSRSGTFNDIFHFIGRGLRFFDKELSAITASLVQLVSLDPTSPTAEEMDNLNLRFLPVRDRIGEYSLLLDPMAYGLPIRECGTTYSANPEPGFRLPTPEDEAKKRWLVEKAVDFYWREAVHHYQHCSDRSDDPRSYENVTKHVQDVHGVIPRWTVIYLFLTPGAKMLAAQCLLSFIVEFEWDSSP